MSAVTSSRGAREARGWRFAPGDHITPELTAMRLLGGGGTFEAWLAFDEITYTAVVVKVVRPHLVAQPGAVAALRREATALAALNHPVLVRGLRHQLDGARPHLVLERIDGPLLSSLVRRHGPLQPQQYLPLAVDVASALHFLRHAGYVHLDVKPSNVIMGAPARLIDLSVARPVAQATALSRSVGTDAYMAPEQCEPTGTGGPGHASDVWGLGATLHHAISGERPFPSGDPDGVTLGDRFPQTAVRAPELSRRVPQEVRSVVAAMLAPDPAARPLPHEVIDALEPVVARQPAARLTG